MNNLLDRISGARDVDNRDRDEIIKALEARVEALLGRVHELEKKNTELRQVAVGISQKSISVQSNG